MRRRIMRRAWTCLIVVHRWIGIATCLLFAMWFVSGFVMMYVPFPQLTEAERLKALPPIAWDRVQVTPDRAMEAAGLMHYPRDLRLMMFGDEPVFRLLDWQGERKTISATDGRAIDAVTPEQALAVAAPYPGSMSPKLIGTQARDQWSVSGHFNSWRPLYLISLGDAAGTEIYVSARFGEIVLDTTRAERIWNWLGSIPHWIYPIVLRKDSAIWRQVVLWISGIGIVVAVTGFWIGVWRVRFSRRYDGSAVTPYHGWKSWHHIAGLIGGVLVIGWIFSGWLSLDPGQFLAERDVDREMAIRYRGNDAANMPAGFLARPGELAAVEARFDWFDGSPLLVLTSGDGGARTLDPETGNPVSISQNRIFGAAGRLIPGANMMLRERLETPDRYWYSHHEARAIPVLRVGFDDAARTWFHIDPVTGDILGRVDDRGRTYRWLFNALHNFDFPWLLRYRPAWDVVMWLLLLPGLVVSVSGVVIGWRRLRS